MKSKQILLAGGVLLAAQAASAEPTLDMSDTLVCAVTEVVGCALAGDCERATPATFNLPVLIRVDIPNMVAESVRAGDEKRASAITAVTDAQGVSVLHGVDETVGWSATIDQASGQMLVVSAHPGIGYTIFGTCANL